MNTHSIVVFIHVMTAMLAFTLVGVELVALPRFLRATTRSEASGWVHVIETLGKAHGASAVLFLASGIFLMVKYWHHQPWIDVGMVGLFTLAGLGGGVTGSTMRGVEKALASASGNEIPAVVRAAQTGSRLVMSLRVRLSIAIAMVAIMTIKPGYVESVEIVAVVLIVGWLLGMRADKKQAARATQNHDRSAAA